MVSVIFKATVLMHFLQFLVDVSSQQSPCPEYFVYMQNYTNTIFGYIEIPSPPKGIALHISVSLSIAAVLPTKYVGKLQLAKSKRQSIIDVNQGRPLAYKLDFPLSQPIPKLTALWFDNQLICIGPPASGPVVTSIVFNHTLYPPGVLNLSQIKNYSTVANSPPVLPWMLTQPHVLDLNNSTSVTASTPTERPMTNEEGDSLTCGRASIMSKINFLVVHGREVTHGQWPWLVAIFIPKLEYEFQCAGTLVSNKHIITAAHCLQNVAPGFTKNCCSGTFAIGMGHYRLHEFRENGSINGKVADYRIHPNFNTLGNADADLAVIILREKVEFNEFIKPICLWTGSTNLENVVGKFGYVVGWGFDELGNRYTEIPRKIKARIVSQEDCLSSNSKFVYAISNRTFCAGLKDGSGPCNGDSGSGFVMHDSETNRYYLRGVVSRSLTGNDTRCDLKQYVVYVDVAKHLDWIQQQIST